jgi:EAL domain-containing protein (putative c-di-GMP-specific phosphodiesterase class I)
MGYSSQVTEGKTAFIKNWRIIKLSSESLADEEFLEYVKEQFVYYQIPPEAVCFEITETAALVNLYKTVQFMRELKSLGCRFCLAGFGNRGLVILLYTIESKESTAGT